MSFTLACLAFITLGLPDGLIGVGWPSIRQTFHLPVDAIGGLLVLFTAGYLLSSFNSGRILARTGIGPLLTVSCAIAGLSLLGYSTAAWWGLMLALSVLAGAGAGAIDAGMNTYAAQNFSARSVNWLHGFYGLGAAIGPLVMTHSLMTQHSWRPGYKIVALGQIFMAAVFLFTTRSRETAKPSEVDRALNSSGISQSMTLRLPAVWVGIALFFFYTGIEAAAGVWAYSLLTEFRFVPMATAGTWVSVYWGCLTAGRILSGLVARTIPPQQMLRFCLLGAVIALLLLSIHNMPELSFAGLALLGLSFAPIFPTLIAATPARLNEHTANAIGFQIAAAVLGQSLIPAFIGVIAGMFTLLWLIPILFVSVLLLLLLSETAASKVMMKISVL